MSWERIEELFLESLDLAESAREARLAFEPDPAVRAEVRAMLAAHEGDGLGIEKRLLDVGGEPDLSGQPLGPWRLVELIGRGGMGEVYLARRDDELYERDVAIKLVRPGPGSSLHARFARERAILARLTHPHVARLYDGGVSDEGHPFLVMEHVRGRPITEWCDEHRLGIDARLRLFARVGQAVQYAHSALIVHRDLKPSNILVDEAGEPRLLDFGIARLLEEDEPERTGALDRILTPEHAAPEQIRGEEPTTSTDVYALGVLLCELLAGDRPLRFPTRSPVEIDRIAREVEPRTPSQLLAALEPEVRAECAAKRRSSPAALGARLRGDLDAICLRALRKDPQERYASVSELLGDLDRHLHAQPVRAMRGTRRYHARKFLRRHRTSLALSAAAFLVLAGFLAVSVMQAQEVRRQRDRARQESARAGRVLDRLVDLFESTSPQAAGEGDLLDVGDFLRRGEETAALLDGDPAAQARMQEILAGIHANRGELERAIELQRAAVERTDDRLLQLQRTHELARLRLRLEGREVGLPLLQASLEAHRELLGPDHPDLLIARIDVAQNLDDPDSSRAMLVDALSRFTAPTTTDGQRRRAAALNALARIEIREVELPEARAHLVEADSLLGLSLPTSSASRIAVRHNLASVLSRMGAWSEAEPLQRELLQLRRRLSGSRSDLTAIAWEGLGVTLANLGRHEEAADCFAHAAGIFAERLGSEHWRTSNAERNVGQLLSLQGRYDEALVHFDRSIASNRDGGRLYGHQRAQRALARLGQGHTAGARATLEGVVQEMRRQAGSYPPTALADALVWLGTAHHRGGDSAAARACFGEALDLRTGALGPDHPRTAEAACGLAAAGGPPAPKATARYRQWGLAHPLLLELCPD